MEIKRSGLQPFAKGPADWFGTMRVTYLAVNALWVASLEFGPATAGRDD